MMYPDGYPLISTGGKTIPDLPMEVQKPICTSKLIAKWVC